MASQDVGDLLEECLKAVAAAQRSMQPTEAKLNYCSCRGQTQDGAIGSLFIWAQAEVRLGFGWGALVVELFSHKSHTYGLCWAWGTRPSCYEFEGISFCLANDFSVEQSGRFLIINPLSSLQLVSTCNMALLKKALKSSTLKNNSDVLFWFWHELSPAINPKVILKQ